jgi:hypothetical protein
MTPDTTAAPVRAAHATLAGTAALLRDQQARKVDVVAPAAAIRAYGGQLVVDDSAPVLGEHGVTMTPGAYIPTLVCDQGIADKLSIPAAYLRRLREERPALYDANVNGWLDGDGRKFLVRCLKPESGPGPGVARAFLSDGYKIIDSLDVLMAALEGIRASGYPVQVDQCDLTERRMYVRVMCNQVRTLAPALLAGYRSPFTGASGADNPVVFSGFAITNSETGCGAFTLTPRLVGQHAGQGTGPDHGQDHRRGARVPGAGVRGAGDPGDRAGRRSAGDRPSRNGAHRQPAAPVLRGAAGQHPEPLHSRRRHHRRGSDARGDQRRADPDRPRRGLGDGVIGAARSGTRRSVTPALTNRPPPDLGADAVSAPWRSAMSHHAVTPLRPRSTPPYNDTAALNDIHAILTTPGPGQASLAEVADVVARTGRPLVAARDIEISSTETALGWPVACAQAGDTAVYVRQQPGGPGLLVEITTETDAEARTLTVTLDGATLHPAGRPGAEPA